MGKTDEVEGSSDLYAVKYPDEEIHPIFKNFNDWVLLIHEGEKSVSSTVGHGLMNTNPYAERRFKRRENFVPLKEILKTGNLDKIYNVGRTRSIDASCDDDDERTPLLF